MKRIASALFLFVCLFVTQSAMAANKPLVLDVWPGKPADDDAANIGEEKFFELKVGGKPYQVGGKPTKWLTNVTKPTLTIYRPAKDKNTGTAMLICPGGGYHNLGWDVEGEEIAGWLNSIGVTGIILKYRCPRRPGDVRGEPPIGPLKDAQRAVSLVRSKAKEWGIDPSKIGMIGFSAGGHLAGATATNFEKRSYEAIDDIDMIGCRPDFAIMAYSGYFKVKDGLSATVRTPEKSPPLFFVHATDDPISDAEHSATFYLALKRAKLDVEMHLYATGGHGFGVRKVGHPCEAWTRTCADWLRSRGFLNPKRTRIGVKDMQTGAREKKLEELGYPLIRGPKEGPVIDLLSVVGDIVFASGQVPFDAGTLTSKGKVPSQVSVEEATKAAALCAANILRAVSVKLGSLDRIERALRMTGYVNADTNFTDCHLVINGATDLVKQVLGEEAGRHARTALGMGQLPLGASVEVEMIFQLKK